MEFRRPFSRKREIQTPENQPTLPESQPTPPEDTLAEYLDLLLKGRKSVSTISGGDQIVLRQATDEDEPNSVAVIDYHKVGAEEINRQSLLKVRYDDGRIVWDVFDKKNYFTSFSDYFEDSPETFVVQIESYFSEQLEEARHAE